jgi:hypothetical protein
MTNKPTPDNDWLSTILADLLNNTHNAPEMAIRKYSGEARAAINAKITELLVEARIDEARLAEEKPITRWRGAESEEEVGYQKGISAQINLANRRQNERIQELQASQPINEKEVKVM